MFEIGKGYYVYRFINDKGVIIYVGRTINLQIRFLNHEHLTKDVKRIEYIECATAADMAWKEIYYINKFYNEFSTNKGDVYGDGKVTDLNITEIWKVYDTDSFDSIDYDSISNKYSSYINNPPNLNYESLIHVIDHNRLNSIGEEWNNISSKWFRDNKNKCVNQLRNNATNYFRHVAPKIHNTTSSNMMWTILPEFKESVKNSGFTKSYVKLGEEIEDKHEKEILAYFCNIFYPVKKNGNEILSDDDYSLTFLLWFIFNSALCDGNQIWIYIPSFRMRYLLKKWIKKNSQSHPINQDAHSPAQMD